jgi:hypothetical protein
VKNTELALAELLSELQPEELEPRLELQVIAGSALNIQRFSR